MAMLKLNKIVIVQIPMAQELRDALKLKAEHLGFSSIQAFVRFWATAQVEGRKIELDDDTWEPDHLALALPKDESAKPPPKRDPPGLGWR